MAKTVAVALRKTPPVSLDDLQAVVRAFLSPHVSRSGLHPRLQGQDRSQCPALASRGQERAGPVRIRTLLTDNGTGFTDRRFGLRKRDATGDHELERVAFNRFDILRP